MLLHGYPKGFIGVTVFLSSPGYQNPPQLPDSDKGLLFEYTFRNRTNMPKVRAQQILFDATLMPVAVLGEFVTWFGFVEVTGKTEETEEIEVVLHPQKLAVVYIVPVQLGQQ